MREFNKSGGFGRRDSDNPKRRTFRSESRTFDRHSGSEGRYDRGDSGRGLEMHRAVCADCGQSCEVPFLPRGNKPVYCRDCFKKNEMGEVRRENRARSSERAEPDHSAEELEKINEKLDKIMKSLNIE
jgi:CxxC-x17-CxxC domain-containing protein